MYETIRNHVLERWDVVDTDTGETVFHDRLLSVAELWMERNAPDNEDEDD